MKYQNIIYIKINEISEHLQIDRRHIRRYINELCDLKCIYKLKYGRRNVYILSPSIAWKGNIYEKNETERILYNFNSYKLELNKDTNTLQLIGVD